MGRVLRNTEGAIRTIDEGNGIYRLQKDIDVLEIIKIKEPRNSKLLLTLGTVGIFGGAAAAVICLAPPIGIMLMAVVAWCLFAANSTKTEREE